MALRSSREPGVWCPARAREIERDLNRLLELVDELEDFRNQFPIQAWACHKAFIELQIKILDKRLSHLLMMQQVAPERNPLNQLDEKGLHAKVLTAQADLKKLAKSFRIKIEEAEIDE